MCKINSNLLPLSTTKNTTAGNGFKLVFLNIWCLWVQCVSVSLSLVIRWFRVPRDPYTLSSFLWVNFLCRLPSCAKPPASFKGCGSQGYTWHISWIKFTLPFHLFITVATNDIVCPTTAGSGDAKCFCLIPLFLSSLEFPDLWPHWQEVLGWRFHILSSFSGSQVSSW